MREHSSRGRGLRLGMLAAVVLAVLGAIVPSVASANSANATLANSSWPQTYLALGDSVAFGYSPLADPANADNFVGYPNKVAAALRALPHERVCPGETSSHFVDLAGSDNNCGLWRSYFPLHVAYSTAQLAFADGFLQSHPETLVVSIDIGANDLLVLVNTCGGAAQLEIPCIMTGLPWHAGDALHQPRHHLRAHSQRRRLPPQARRADRLLDRLRQPPRHGRISQVNQVVAARTLAWGGIVADGFGAFAAASAAYNGDTCAAGLRIVVSPPSVCDSHPSRAGRNLLAQTIVKALR